MNHSSFTKFKFGAERGATLIEVLVALLVLSIGLLGVAALQVSALQTNQSAHVRSQASVLAYDIADRMRANRAVALAGGYNVVYTVTPTGTNLNQLDLQNWKTALANTLPTGQGELVLVGNIAVIRVKWSDKLGTQVFETRTQI
ncbi:MAG: type IV pilus modification protein PilV [Pseudomonadota bacterium]